MGMQNLSILIGAALSASGGTPVTYTPDGQVVPGGIRLIDASVTDMRIRPYVVARTTIPTVNGSGKLVGKYKNFIYLVEPFIQADGTISMDSIRIERSVSPERSAATVLELLKKGGQFCFDADLASWWATGSTA